MSAPEGVSHPLLADIRNFRTNDEIYLVERTTDIDVLLETTYVGPTTGVPAHWDDDTPQPVSCTYAGLVADRLCTSRSAMRLSEGTSDRWSMMMLARLERCSWEVPEFLAIIENAFEWAWSN